MYIPLSSSILRRIRFILHQNLPEVSCAHIAEALASSLGFNSAIACAQSSVESLPGAWANVSITKFCDRLISLGYKQESIVEDRSNVNSIDLYIQSIFTIARSDINQTQESKKSDFCYLIAEAVHQEASDIHLMYLSKGLNRISVRINQKMHWVDNRELLENNIFESISSIASWFPADQKSGLIDVLNLAVSKDLREIHLRTISSDFFILRLRYWVEFNSGLQGLGFGHTQSEQVSDTLKSKSGITFISGPTGSGKSTTDYFLSDFSLSLTRHSVDRENCQTGSTHDPDHMKTHRFGEIRDSASADILFTSAMLGYKSQVTIHANDAFSIFNRLLDSGVKEYKVYDQTLMSCLISQRLIAKNCKFCARSINYSLRNNLVSKELVERIKKCGFSKFIGCIKVANTLGCNECKHTGYGDKRIICEVIKPDEKFMNFMQTGQKQLAHEYWKDHLDGFTMLECATHAMICGELDPSILEERFGEITLISPNRLRKILKKG